MALTTYLDYMQKVLGIREVLLSNLPTLEVSERPAEHQLPIKVLFIDRQKWSASAQELFSKMREAMKLNADDIKIIFAADVAMTDIQLQCLQSQQIVSFDSSISHSLTAEFSTQLITTLGPEVLLKDAAKKKITWADLQQVMKRL